MYTACTCANRVGTYLVHTHVTQSARSLLADAGAAANSPSNSSSVRVPSSLGPSGQQGQAIRRSAGAGTVVGNAQAAAGQASCRDLSQPVVIRDRWGEACALDAECARLAWSANTSSLATAQSQQSGKERVNRVLASLRLLQGRWGQNMHGIQALGPRLVNAALLEMR